MMPDKSLQAMRDGSFSLPRSCWLADATGPVCLSYVRPKPYAPLGVEIYEKKHRTRISSQHFIFSRLLHNSQNSTLGIQEGVFD